MLRALTARQREELLARPDRALSLLRVQSLLTAYGLRQHFFEVLVQNGQTFLTRLDAAFDLAAGPEFDPEEIAAFLGCRRFASLSGEAAAVDAVARRLPVKTRRLAFQTLVFSGGPGENAWDDGGKTRNSPEPPARDGRLFRTFLPASPGPEQNSSPSPTGTPALPGPERNARPAPTDTPVLSGPEWDARPAPTGTPALPGPKWNARPAPTDTPVLSEPEWDGSPRLRDLYDVLQRAGGQSVRLGSFEGWYVDFSHRLRHGCADAFLLRRAGKPVSCCLVTAKSRRAGLIGGLATVPQDRGRGDATRLLQSAVARLRAEGRAPVLECEPPLLAFYKARGFFPAADGAACVPADAGS